MGGAIAAMEFKDIVSLASAAVALTAVVVSGTLGALGFRHARRLAWDERIWSRRADLYVDLFEWLLATHSARKPFAPTKTSDEEDWDPPLVRHDLRARIAAFASPEVRKRYSAAIGAIANLEQVQNGTSSAAFGDKRVEVFRRSEWSRQKISELERQIRSELEVPVKKPRVVHLLSRTGRRSTK